MKFERVAVLRVKGLTHSGAEVAVDSLESGAVSPTIAADPAPYCIHADRASAVALMMLNATFRAGPAFSEDLLDREVTKIRGERTQAGQSAYLVLRHIGDVETMAPSAQAEVAGFVVCFDAVDKTAVRALSQHYLVAAVAALALESRNVTGIEKVADSVVLFRGDGKPVFSYTGSGSADMSVSSPLAADAPARLAQWLRPFATTDRLRLVAKLLAHAVASEGDNLKAFLSTFTALEVFVKRSFPAYMVRLLGAPRVAPAAGAAAFCDRIREEVAAPHGKRGVRTKFGTIAVVVAPDDAERDFLEFSAIYDLRNVVHEDAMDVSKRDVDRAQALLRKYLRLHIATLPST